jgi:hypothetical protein
MGCILIAALAAGATAAEKPVDFSREVRPILANYCFKCHGPDEAKREADLRLDTREVAVADRGGYKAIDVDEPAASALLARITSQDESERMPPVDSGMKLTDTEIETLRGWIDEGAPYDPHWSFRRVERPAVPIVNSSDSSWPKHEIDHFVLQQLDEHKLRPSPEASRNTLIRRVHLDVTGLPPTPDEVDEFVRDEFPDAYERMVDRALASPHYGERWGRHWLDQARYADTNGYTVDSPRSMWPYRDWVIKALNDDMPFDKFTIEQLAGDLIPDHSREQLVATGFHRNTLINEEGGTDNEQFRVEAVVDRVNTTGAVWLGLTIACAQCHSHKFDPVTQREYYQLYTFFNNCEDVNTKAPVLKVMTAEQTGQLADFDKKIRAARARLAGYDARQAKRKAETVPGGDATAEDADSARTKLAAELASLREARKQFLAPIPDTMIMRETKTPRESHLLVRGDFLRKGEKVSAGTPAVLPPMPESTGSRTRLDLARWLVDRRNPLTARVAVNRIWAHYFGQGLVETENDFGFQGTPPTHPELLDWLAAEFMAPADGSASWSLKHIHRLILTSATYRQSSELCGAAKAADPLNKMLGRQARLRVDAEIVRDLSLAVSGLLNQELGGPSVYPPQPEGVYAFTQRAMTWPTSTGPDRYRRGMYTFFMRSAPYPELTTFDAPVFNTTCTFRPRSNTPLQALTMANDATLVEASQALGKRIREHSADDDERFGFAYLLCFSRSPEPFEVKRLAAYLGQQRKDFAAAADDARKFADVPASEEATDAAAWTAVARVLLNLDEFITRE